jgi:toxin YoeB
MRKIAFENNAFSELSEWATENKKTFDRIIKLIQESSRTPFTGTGKPEALKHD